MTLRPRLYAGTLITGLCAAIAGCEIALGPQLQGSGVVKTEMRAVGEFTEIEVGHAIELEITLGPAADLVLTADDNLLPHVRTDVSQGRLRISCDRNYFSSIGVKFLVTMPELNAIVGSGAARISAANVESPEFLLDLSGASHCELAAEANTMTVKLNGASNATLTGSANEFTVEASGASQLHAQKLVAEKVKANLSGATIAEVYVNADLEVEASGASNLRYAGEPPQFVAKTTGASTVAKQ